jgi:hypothetical protein
MSADTIEDTQGTKPPPVKGKTKRKKDKQTVEGGESRDDEMKVDEPSMFFFVSCVQPLNN